MTRDEATSELRTYLGKHYPEFIGTIDWKQIGRSYFLARLTMSSGGQALATFGGGRLTIFDSIARLEKPGDKWQQLDGRNSW